MGYDPNDPNQGSQAPGYEGDPYAGGQSLDALVKSRPGIAPWLAAHRGGYDLSDQEKAQLFGLIQRAGIDTGMLELGDDGTFNAGTGHTLRDIAYGSLLAFGPLVAAWAAPYVASAVAGGGGASTAAETGTTALGPSTAANLAATSTVAGGAGVPPSLAAVGSTSVAGLSYGDLIKYGLPVAGNLIGGLIQAKATSSASDAQMKYLEEALAYQKEQDAYTRTRQAGLDALEQQRYGDYQGRIAGFIGNGQSSNDRMTALLGLPARSFAASGGGSAPTSGASRGVPVTPDITAKLTDYYRSQGLTPTGTGTGPTDIDYMAKMIAATGGLTPENTAYWLDPSAKGRITQELTKAGVTFGAPASSSAPPAAAAPPASSPPAAAAPATSAAMVQLRSPDGRSTRAVPADQADYYKSRGATVIGAAA